MISSFFGKTKPINYIVLLSFVFVFYWLVHLPLYGRSYGPTDLLIQLVVLAVLCLGYFVQNFIIKRNKITGQHSFSLLFFTLLVVIFPETLLDFKAIVSTFFIMIAMRRLISIKSLKNIRSKLFDATIWIMIASLFYDWAVLYLILVYMATYIYEPKNLRNWLAPLAGVFAFLIIVYGILVLAGNTEYLQKHYLFGYSASAITNLDWTNSTRLLLYVLGITVVGLFSFVSQGKAGMGKVATMRLIAMLFVIGIVLKVLLSGETQHPIMLTFFPASIFLAQYIESIKRPNIKEIVLMLSIFVPFMGFFISLILR